MKLIHQEVECTCKKKNKVIIELTEDEAAHLADHFVTHKASSCAGWPETRALAKAVVELAGQW